ncbi:MAG: 1-phosphofructokinase [Miltoncostaeaceae bacterium]|nr:1-phosphofructokinase [Miltoncostaeaceae bacterium]
MTEPGSASQVAVMSPWLQLRISIVTGTGTEPLEIHVHAGGQGFWVARLVSRLGVPVTLCAPVGGESGDALRGLVPAEGVTLAGADGPPNAVWISDGRGGEPATIAETEVPGLGRHAVDELVGLALAAGLDCGICVLTGALREGVLDPEVYRRLARDLRRNGARVVADLSGADLAAALEGGVDVLKLSDEELVGDGYASGDGLPELVEGIDRLRRAGAEAVVLSRADQPTIAHTGDRLIVIEPPSFEPVNPHGAGDSMTAALAAGMAHGVELSEALRLAAVAGALNVTRLGLGTGDRDAIERLRDKVKISDLEA